MGESQQSDVTIAAYLGFANEKKKIKIKHQISETITKNISRKWKRKGKGSIFNSGIHEFSFQVPRAQDWV